MILSIVVPGNTYFKLRKGFGEETTAVNEEYIDLITIGMNQVSCLSKTLVTFHWRCLVATRILGKLPVTDAIGISHAVLNL